jgi:hypothetical protein
MAFSVLTWPAYTCRMAASKPKTPSKSSSKSSAAAPVARSTGSPLVKRGLAEMMKGGVIMDVVNAEQAKIAEDAGACAVMALERVPADIRVDGGVARMSDPEMIEGIQAVVTIPVMAKVRIGHFVEAQILEALGVDYVDESEVLTPADEAHHIDKWAFTVPFVCGATNLGEALRRISEGACMIRSKGEAGTGNIVEAVRHLRSIIGDIRPSCSSGPSDCKRRSGSCRKLPKPAGCPFRCSAPVASPLRPTRRSPCSLALKQCSLGPVFSSRPTRRLGPRPLWKQPPTSATRTFWRRSAVASVYP